MERFGLIVVLMWISIIPFLYPFPPQLVEHYKIYITEKTDIYILTLDEEDKTEYVNNSDRFLESELESKKIVIWIKWSLKLCLIALGVLAGWLLYNKKRFRYIVLPTSAIYLMMWISQMSEILPAWGGAPWLGAYIEFLVRGSFTESTIVDLFFYNQYLILPILHLVLLVGCVFLRNVPDNRLSKQS